MLWLFFRFGYFFNLRTESWEKHPYPPYDPLDGLPNAMWSFRGRPTVFGSNECDDQGDCSNKKIVQVRGRRGSREKLSD